MDFKKIFNQLNVFNQCKRYKLSLWQCPQFLFVIMGLIIIISMIATYQIGTTFIENPEIVSLIVVGITVILLILGFIITQSFERLAMASRMKTEFVNIVSHQLRSPLSNLKWGIELLMSGRLGKIEKKQTEYFEILKENSDRMEELIKDLLIVSKIESGKLPLRKKEFSIKELIKKVISDFKHIAGASNANIKFQSQKNLPNIFADFSQIRLVIENLLDNAIRYTKDKGVIKIKLEQKNKYLHFEIIDNGIGIPEEDQNYIFQKFFRSENILKHQTQGSGLGLYIAKSIIQKSKGKIGFKSEENKGSTFWFNIPIK